MSGLIFAKSSPPIPVVFAIFLKRIAALLNDPDTKIPKNFRPKEQEAEKIALAEEEKLEKASGGSGNRKKKKKNKKNKRR